ncbi:unnamed protein product [Lactuca saligna]|uniref:Uncharacterized protein n=1 Tax=Lactuca saligna TaxID=75948 RepID=A0AA35YV84_LACSI|nr:unnamed protein product [Lactuca saligna]
MAVRQQPHQKKYKLSTGCVNVSHFHKPGNRVHTKAIAQEACDSWRKRGNEVYKSGDLSEAEKSCNYTHGSWKNEVKCLNDCRMAATLDPNFMKVNKLLFTVYNTALFIYALTRFVVSPLIPRN